ncbi:uncharacterized protein DEA37_0001519 [Paragonimus westermani]|uniref:Nucleoside phosphorylase domain-containing protein n=1 Tax=Paragonimus westermani TaxID=34504 RepID=A0A5J4P0Z5_9TREM|nr:uncharacterized protein DEA37_0001519 [Paragonimus westermani]
MTDMYVTMTPIHFDKMKTIRFERTNRLDQALVHHVAGGQHSGIIVNKEVYGNHLSVVDTPEMQLEFTCVMYNSRTAEMHAQFVFEERYDKSREHAQVYLSCKADVFELCDNGLNCHVLFKCQVAALRDEQPFGIHFGSHSINHTDPHRDSDYTGFIKKVLKQLHGPRFPRFRRVDLDIIPLDKQEQEALVPEVPELDYFSYDGIQCSSIHLYPPIFTVVMTVHNSELFEKSYDGHSEVMTHLDRLSTSTFSHWLSSVTLLDCPCPLCVSTWIGTASSSLVDNRSHDVAVNHTEPLTSSVNLTDGHVEWDNSERERRPPEQVLRDAVQMRLEEAYPNILSMDELVRRNRNPSNWLGCCYFCLSRKLTVPSTGHFDFAVYVWLGELTEVKEVKGTNNMQQVSVCEKPTIAIITNLLCEKLAVDAMIEQKTTFVRYRTEGGESHVYTIGSIGPHRVISTKLPMVGSELKAKISSASITTRLLGAFQAVQHVFLVGVGGSVPHVYEFEKHSRLGDVVVSAPVGLGQSRSPNGNGNHANKRGCDPVYIYCDRLVELSDDMSSEQPFKFVLKQYEIRDSSLLDCVGRVLDRFEQNPSNCQWAEILTSSMKLVSEGDAVNFDRPPSETDKLKLKVDQGVTFDIKHPEVPENLVSLYPPGIPAVRLGCLGSGRPITDNDQLRDSFAKEHQLLCYDSEYDQVLESVLGNGLNSFLIIRGMADYVEGRRNTQWQPYAALAAASFMKAVILELPPCRLDED